MARGRGPHLKDGAAHVGRVDVRGQLDHQLLQEVRQDGGRDHLPVLRQDLADAQDRRGADHGLGVLQKRLFNTNRKSSKSTVKAPALHKPSKHEITF